MKYLLITLFFFCFQLAFAQDDSFKILKGTVRDDEGYEMIGCFVAINNARSRGTMCDIDGNYTIEVKVGETIEYSFVGYKKKEIKYNGEERIDIVLEEDCPDFGDPIFYFKWTNMYDISTSLSRNDYGFDAGQDMSKGLFSGLHLQTDGNIFDPNISIRSGIGGIGGETRFVVDGVADAPFNFSDIISINILRDPASVIVYGSATAPGGVMNIDTEHRNKEIRRLSIGSRMGVVNAAALLPNNNKDLYNSHLSTRLTQHYDLKFADYWRYRSHLLQVSGLVSYDDIDGVIKGNEEDRFTSRLSLKYLKSSWLNLSQTIYYDKQRQDDRWLFFSEADPEQKVNVGRIDTNPRHEFFSATSAKVSPWEWMNIKSTIAYDRVNNRGGRAD